MSSPAAPAVPADSTRVTEILQRHRRRILALIHRRLGRGVRRLHDPADVFQDVVVGVLTRERDLALAAPECWSTYLTAAAENKVRQLRRRYAEAGKRDLGRDVPMEELADTAKDRLIGREQGVDARAIRLEILDNLCIWLPLSQAAVIAWYGHGYPIAKIARAMGITERQARYRVQLGTRKLQSLADA